jgi:hypothetical protein
MASEREIENAKVMAAHAVRMERMSGLASTLPTWSLVGVVADHTSPLVSDDDARVMERNGASVEDILKRLESVRQRQRIVFSLDTLEYARMSGRVKALQAALASALRGRGSTGADLMRLGIASGGLAVFSRAAVADLGDSG